MIHTNKKPPNRDLQQTLSELLVLVLSVPNNHFIANILDPAWFFGYKHYKLSQLSNFFTGGIKNER